MRRALHRIVKTVSPGTAAMLAEWHLTLSGHRHELLKQYIENHPLSVPSGALAHADTIERLRGEKVECQRLAFVSVVPPATTGIATCTVRSWLGSRWPVDIFCPVLDDDWFFATAAQLDGASGGQCRLLDVKAILFAMQRAKYNAIVIAIGNSSHHAYIFDLLKKIHTAGLSHRVVLYLHDVCLLHLLLDSVKLPIPEYIDFLEGIYGKPLPSQAKSLDKWQMSEMLIEQDVLGVRFFTTLGVKRFLVNSRAAADLCERDLVGTGSRIDRIFHPAALPPDWSQARFQNVRGKRGRPVVVGTFGVPGPDKRTELVIAAMRRLKKLNPHVRLAFGGFGCKQWAARHLDELHGIDVDVRDLPSEHDFLRFMDTVDVAVQLRLKNRGESSGAVHELLALGKNVIVSDVGSFKEFGDAVRTIPADASPTVLANAIQSLLESPIPRHAIELYVESHSKERFGTTLWELCKGKQYTESSSNGRLRSDPVHAEALPGFFG